MFETRINRVEPAQGLTIDQLNALAILPDYQDPYFAVHRAMHAIKAKFIGAREIPLTAPSLIDECGSFSNCAAMALRRIFHIEVKDLRLIQILTLLHGESEDVLRSKAKKEWLMDGKHLILYVKGGLRFLPGNQKGDVFFDSTCGQFTSNGSDERSERVFEYLKSHGGDSGSEIANALMNRGYVKIPEGSDGAKRLGVLVASFRAPRAWIDEPDPIDPQSLIGGIADVTEKSSAVQLYEGTASTGPHRNLDWIALENLFAPGVPNGQLKLDIPGYEIKYDPSWHQSNV